MPDFRQARESGFDFDHDYGLIVSSFAAAYGLRIRDPRTDIPWPEFLDLLGGLPGDMPLPMIIGIRLSTDKEAENLSAAAQKARDDWYLWLAAQDMQGDGGGSVKDLENLFKSMFGR